MDKDRSIEHMIVSYYHRSEHINQIKSHTKLEFEQMIDMLSELEKERKEILQSIKLIDKNFDIEYLKENYIIIFNTIQSSWEQIKTLVGTNMLKAYYDILCKDIIDGNLFSCFSMIKEIGSRFIVLCPKKNKLLFSEKFNDINLHDILYEANFNSKINKFIIFMVDYITMMDAPCNDIINKEWKQSVLVLINSNNFAYDFPKILMQIQEHIDIIYSIIAKLNE